MWHFKLTKINLFYGNITIDNEWEVFSEQSDLVLWKLDKNSDKNVSESNNSDQTDSDDGLKGNEKFKEGNWSHLVHLFQLLFKIVNIAPEEGQIPVSFTSEPNWEARAFPKDYSWGRNHFNEEREILNEIL